MNKTEVFNILESIELLKGDFYKKVIDKESFIFLVSVFKESSYNFIIPKVKPNDLDLVEIKKLVKNWKKYDYKFSYYIPSDLHDAYKDFIFKNKLKLTFTDLYVYKINNIRSDLEKRNIVSISKENLKEFVKSTEICFPDWENNSEFTKWCLNCKNVYMFGVQEGSNISSFGAYLMKENSDYALLMNAGTIPDYRRQGLHDYMIKYRINDILNSKKNTVIYANVEINGYSHKGFQKLGFEDGPLFYVYE